MAGKPILPSCRTIEKSKWKPLSSSLSGASLTNNSWNIQTVMMTFATRDERTQPMMPSLSQYMKTKLKIILRTSMRIIRTKGASGLPFAFLMPL